MHIKQMWALLWMICYGLLVEHQWSFCSPKEHLCHSTSHLRSGGTEVMTLPGMDAGRRSLCRQRWEDISADDWQTYPGPYSSDTYKHKQEELDVYSQKFYLLRRRPKLVAVAKEKYTKMFLKYIYFMLCILKIHLHIYVLNKNTLQ